MVIRYYDQQLETVPSFKNLVHLLTATYDNFLYTMANLRKARNIWYRMVRILGRGGADTSNPSHLYVAIIQYILMFVLGTWFVTPRIKCLLGVFHHRLAWRI